MDAALSRRTVAALVVAARRADLDTTMIEALLDDPTGAWAAADLIAAMIPAEEGPGPALDAVSLAGFARLHVEPAIAELGQVYGPEGDPRTASDEARDRAVATALVTELERWATAGTGIWGRPA